jgi:large subunit ribosomal protein L25
VLREIEVECLPTDIPQYIEVDVSPLAIHDAVHLADLEMPPNVKAVFENNDAVVTVLPPTVEEVKAVEAAVEAPPVEGAAPAEAEVKEKEKEPKESGKSS